MGGLLILGCGETEEVNETSIVISDKAMEAQSVTADMIRFTDTATTMPLPEVDVMQLRFMTLGHLYVDLQTFHRPGSKLILVVMKGFQGGLSPYCITQAAQLIANYSKFTDRDTEIVIAFPVETDQESSRLEELQLGAAAQLRSPQILAPMPMVLDVGLESVKKLGIEKNLASPATYIFDSTGTLKFAYVGKHVGDRPSVQAMLDEVDRLP